MRCSICGKQVPTGTLCDACYRDAMGDKKVEYKRDVNKNVDNNKMILMKITRKFLPKYQLLVEWELVLFSIFLLGYAIILKRFSFIILAILFDFILLAFILFIGKRIAMGTKCIFYENKIAYKFDFLFIHKKLEYKYSDIQDIVYNQRFLQKRFGLGDITIITKKQSFFFKGFVIQNVANVNEVFEKLTNKIGTKIV